jgi:hypothetical protein
MPVQLITALHAAETLAAYHRQQATHRGDDYDVEMAERCEKDIAHLKAELMDYGLMPEDHALAPHQHDVAVAQAIIGRHMLPEWRAFEQAPHMLDAMAQEIADAMEAARRGEILPG